MRGEARVAATGLRGSRAKGPDFVSGQEVLERGVADPRRLDPKSRREGGEWPD